jgi:hypothetical protein
VHLFWGTMHLGIRQTAAAIMPPGIIAATVRRHCVTWYSSYTGCVRALCKSFWMHPYGLWVIFLSRVEWGEQPEGKRFMGYGI